MAKPLVIETPDNTPPAQPPDVTKLADAATPTPATAPPAKPKAKANTEALEQFAQMQIGSDRYKEIAGAAKEEPKSEPASDEPQRGPDGKFLKATEKKPAPKAKETPKPVPFKPKPQPAAPAMTTEEIVAAAAEGAARAFTATKAKPDDAPKVDEPKLPPDEQDKVEILSKMEVLYPAKYKGIADKYKKSLKALDTYAKEWEKNNTGQEFDESSPEHAEFYKENDVDWSDLDFQKAIARIAAEDAVKPLEQKANEREAESERQKELERRQGEIVAQQNTAAQHFWGELGDDVADFVNADGSLNMAKVKQLQESDPEGLSIRVTAAKALDAEVAEIHKLYAGLVKNDPDGNQIHRNVNQFAAAQERKLAMKPTDEKLNREGKVFVPAAQWFRMTKTERENHWTFSAEDIAFLRAKDLASATNKRIEFAEEAHKRWAKSRGIQLEDPNEKPDSPESGGESRLAAVGVAPTKTSSSAHSQFLGLQLHGS